jgi:hypothetical protein
MVLYPECQKKAQAEIDSVIGSSRLPTFEDRERLPYVECICRETLRSAFQVSLNSSNKLFWYRWNPAVPLGKLFPLNPNINVHNWFLLHRCSSSLYPRRCLPWNVHPQRLPYLFKYPVGLISALCTSNKFCDLRVPYPAQCPWMKVYIIIRDHSSQSDISRNQPEAVSHRFHLALVLDAGRSSPNFICQSWRLKLQNLNQDMPRSISRW